MLFAILRPYVIPDVAITIIRSPSICSRYILSEYFYIVQNISLQDNNSAGTILLALTMQMKAAEPLKPVKLKNPAPKRTVGILWRNGGYRSKAALEFARLLEEHVEDE